MRLLLDTHAFLWWRVGSAKLSVKAHDAILDSSNEILVSAAVAWEIVIKRALKRLEFEGSVSAAIAEEGFVPLPITTAHVDELALLPEHHRDPFDRLLIAQARRDGLTLVTHDKSIREYTGFASLRA